VKEAVFLFIKLPGVDTVLGPGDEVDRRGDGHRREAGARSSRRRRSRPVRCAARRGRAFISATQAERLSVAPIARARRRGFSPSAPAGRPRTCARRGLTVEVVNKVFVEAAATSSDRLRAGEVALVINTPPAGASVPRWFLRFVALRASKAPGAAISRRSRRRLRRRRGG
jgi:carbamoyl-phosphate synthase large subunit